MQSDFAVGLCSETVASLFQFAALPLEIVELPVDDNPDALIFIGDGLVASGEINDAQARMTQSDTVIVRNPGSLAIGPTMVERVGGRL